MEMKTKLNKYLMKTTDVTPIEVTAEQYRMIMVDYAGCAAGRKEDGKFYVKLWAHSKYLMAKLGK